MTIEGGARAGFIQPDEKTLKYLENKPFSKMIIGKGTKLLVQLKIGSDSNFDKEVIIDDTGNP